MLISTEVERWLAYSHLQTSAPDVLGETRNLCKGFLKHSNLIREITVALKQRIPILVINIQQGETQHSNEVRVGIFLIPIFLCLTLSPRQKLYFCMHLEFFFILKARSEHCRNFIHVFSAPCFIVNATVSKFHRTQTRNFSPSPLNQMP